MAALTLAQLAALFDQAADGTLTLKRAALPAATDQDVADLATAVAKFNTGGTPAPAPSPVVSASASEMLPADFQKPFSLTGTGIKPYLVDVVKDAVYSVKVEVASTDGGGVGVVFVDPANGSGFGYQKLSKGTNALKITATATGRREFRVAANNGNSAITTVSLTKI
jgi:hypothetical protein